MAGATEVKGDNGSEKAREGSQSIRDKLDAAKNDLSPEQRLDLQFIAECNKYLIELDVESGPKAFKFPYIDTEKNTVILADGIMEQEKITIGGREYSITAPKMPPLIGPRIILTNMKFPGGYSGEAVMKGSLFGINSPVGSSINTAKLYEFLDALRTGKTSDGKSIEKGEIQILPAPPFGDIEFKAL